MDNFIKVYSEKNSGESQNNSIVSIGYSIVEDENHSVLRPKGLNNYQLIYLKKGEMLLYENYAKYKKYKNGTIIIFPPNVIQHYTHLSNTKNENYWVHFDGIDEILKKLKLYTVNVPLVVQINNNEKLCSLWKDIITELQLSIYASTIIANAKFIQLLTMISREIYNTKNPKDNQIFHQLTPAIIEIHNNYSQDVSNSYYASLCNMSESSFYHHFIETLKTTPSKYINNVRLQAAQNLLLDTNLTLEKISILVGYSTPQYLSKLFTQKYGVSPLKFKKNSSQR